MHREISHADETFVQESRLPLYLLTALLGLLIGLDLWPAIASWASTKGMSLPSWPREIYGYRIALIAAVLGGARILYGSLESLLEGRIGADLALAIACVAAILINEPLVAAEIVFIGMVGECLESITFERTQRAVRRIVEVSPRRCWLLRDGQEVRVLTSEVQVGDRVVVKPGGRVPVDGVVVDGRSALDTSALTGESLPVDKGTGDEVLAGSLNQLGALTIEARRVAEHTVVGRVIELTARALKDKAPLERTADRLARYFLPAVLGLAALTFFVTLLYHVSPWFRPAGAVRLGLGEAARLSIYPTLAVLVVACPCALILATPAAIIAALGRLAGTGVLIKGGSALERLAAVNAFAFDKTGTLTEGRLELGDVIGLNGISADDLLAAAATAEQRSEHLLARLITEAAGARGLTLGAVEDFLAHPGAGVTARTATGNLVVGTRRLLEEQGIEVPDEASALLEQLDATGQATSAWTVSSCRINLLLEQLDATGQTTLLVARDGVILGVIGARDRVRPEAAAMLAELRALGIHDLALLTGDRPAVAHSIAEQLHITDVRAQLLPVEKAEFISAWSRTSAHGADRETVDGEPPTLRRVAMVGDGINDAPALARAHVGLAIGGSGTDVAAEAGDIVFMGDPLGPIPLLVRLSRETVRIIRQNILIFAFGVNAFGILLTAWLWPLLAPAEWYEQAPVAAVIYHQLGSLAVLLNAMRLLWFERWGRVRHVVGTADQWMEHHLDVGELFHWLEHHWRRVTAAAVLLLAAGYALSGLTQIGPDELGIVRRFGRALDEDLTPGLYWRWPWPVEEVVRVQPDRVHTVEIGFRSVPGVSSLPTALAWSSPHGGEGLRRMPEEAVMITGDGNLVELQATIRYRIRDPRAYLFEVRDPVEVIRATTEAVLRETTAARSFGDLLTTNRDQFQKDVRARLVKRLAEESPHALGITLDGIALHDLHPPQEVVQAYHEVTKAMEDSDRMVNEAEARALQDERRKQSEALETVRIAEATRNEKIKLAEADQAAFLDRYHARTSLSLQQEWSLLGDSLGAVWRGQPIAAACEDYQSRRRDSIALQIALTDFRLFWDRLGLALSNRDKVIIDADQVPGKRNLLLFDPDQLRMPIPVLTPPERAPIPGSGNEGP